MTRDETKTILKRLSNHHPSFFKDKSTEDLTEIVNEWHSVFESLPMELMSKAIALQEELSPYMPSVNDIKKRLKGMYYTAVSEIATMSSELFYDEKYDTLIEEKERIAESLRRFI